MTGCVMYLPEPGRDPNDVRSYARLVPPNDPEGLHTVFLIDYDPATGTATVPTVQGCTVEPPTSPEAA